MHAANLGVGQRIRIAEDYGTILFIGEVAGTTGTWLGVEWDNGVKRGKHNGNKNGVQYFTCRIPGSGSFLRPTTPGLITGIGFDTALLNKYVDTFRADGIESVVLGSSNGTILVEGPRLDRVRTKFSQIERLRNISLNNQDVATPGDSQVVSKLCQSVKNLDLSQTLLGNWDTIADIIRHIPRLSNLELNCNRIQLAGPLNTINFPKLTQLRLNSTLICWAEACEILVYLPDLQDLQLGYNRLLNLSPSSEIDTAKALPSLTTLNLDSNLLSDWVSTIKSCSMVTNLRNLMMPSNAIDSIPRRINSLGAGQQSLLLEHLALTDNPIYSWSDIDCLVSWFPKLYDLSISFEPLASAVPPGTSRSFIIARLPLLKKLNGTEVTERERIDAELFYLSWISKNEHSLENDIEIRHPRWRELATKYNTSAEIFKPAIENLGSHMINVGVARIRGPISKDQVVHIQDMGTTLRVLPTMTVKAFGMKLKKVMKLPAQVVPESLWLLSASNSGEATAVRCFDADPSRDISWSGVDNGALIGFVHD